MDASKKTKIDLEEKILTAHQNNDGVKLAELYAKAAYTTSNINKACFFMVNAYTLALEYNHPDTLSFFQFLQKYDREKQQSSALGCLLYTSPSPRDDR